jgi:hypothetical protein
MTLDLDTHDEEYKQFKMKQQTNNIWREIAIALIIIIVFGFVLWGIKYLNNDNYQKGISDGVNQTIQEIALSQVQTGNILVYNGSVVTTIPITQICQNILDAQRGASLPESSVSQTPDTFGQQEVKK